jgi:hypothetical protein
MSENIDQVEIVGEIVASPQKTEAVFEEKKINLVARVSRPLFLVFTAKYSFEEQLDVKLNDWEFYMTITDEQDGTVLKSEYLHFGEEEQGYIGKNDDAYKDYLEEEDFLKHYKSDDRLKKGDGTIVRSLKTPSEKGIYTYKCQLISRFWARNLGEEKGLEKNKTESIAEVIVSITVE